MDQGKDKRFHNRPAVIDVDGAMWEFVSESNDWFRISDQPVAFTKIASIISPHELESHTWIYYLGAIGIDGRYYQQEIEFGHGPVVKGPWIQLPEGPKPGSGFWFVD
jgi:hypothetical protein